MHTAEKIQKRSRTTRDMTQGNPYGHMVAFAMPVLLSQIFQQLYNTADTFIVGKFLGTDALAAVSSSGTLIFLLTSFFVGTTMGSGVVISRYFGAGDGENISRAVHTNIAFGLVSSVILTVFGVAFTPTFLTWMKTDPTVLPQAIEYFRYYFLGATAMIMPKHHERRRRQPKTFVLSHIFLRAEHSARPAFCRGIPLGRMVGRCRDRYLSGGKRRALLFPTDEKGADLQRFPQKNTFS